MHIQTDLKPAPEELLSVISCGCLLTTKRRCSTQMCSVSNMDYTALLLAVARSVEMYHS